MSSESWRHRAQLIPNTSALREAFYGPTQREILSREAHFRASDEIRSWEGYAATPLRRLRAAGSWCRVGEVLYKDESDRFGMGSFKALGGSYAVSQALIRSVRLISRDRGVTCADLRSERYRALVSRHTITCATDGNHGRSVAWAAHRFGCRCVVYLHERVSRWRADAIAAWGARIERVKGNYDDAARQSIASAVDKGWIVVSDTAPAPDPQIPRDVLQGYTVMVEEVLSSLGPLERPTHVFVQAGVGGLAAAVAAHLWEYLGSERPTLTVVEPEHAACVFRTVQAGRPVAIKGDLDTVMAGLACGQISLDAWPILHLGAEFAMTIPDDAALDAVRYLACGASEDGSPIVSGESGAAGLAGFFCAAHDPEMRGRLGVDERSRVLIFGTEGATDPDLYAAIVK